MVSTRDANAIARIDAYCDQILAAMRRFGNSIAELEIDGVYRDAMAIKIQQIS
ncbi:MAG: hypothetical protein LBR80_04075 [Deltaproteobacteria bacterium]|jgi:hypothetical protein|nr:hypothetical protein [Deltaproteobacteria bacterium]